jgi:hypothetical protein
MTRLRAIYFTPRSQRYFITEPQEPEASVENFDTADLLACTRFQFSPNVSYTAISNSFSPKSAPRKSRDYVIQYRCCELERNLEDPTFRFVELCGQPNLLAILDLNFQTKTSTSSQRSPPPKLTPIALHLIAIAFIFPGSMVIDPGIVPFLLNHYDQCRAHFEPMKDLVGSSVWRGQGDTVALAGFLFGFREPTFGCLVAKPDMRDWPDNRGANGLKLAIGHCGWATDWTVASSLFRSPRLETDRAVATRFFRRVVRDPDSLKQFVQDSLMRFWRLNGCDYRCLAKLLGPDGLLPDSRPRATDVVDVFARHLLSCPRSEIRRIWWEMYGCESVGPPPRRYCQFRYWRQIAERFFSLVCPAALPRTFFEFCYGADAFNLEDVRAADPADGGAAPAVQYRLEFGRFLRVFELLFPKHERLHSQCRYMTFIADCIVNYGEMWAKLTDKEREWGTAQWFRDQRDRMDVQTYAELVDTFGDPKPDVPGSWLVETGSRFTERDPPDAEPGEEERQPLQPPVRQPILLPLLPDWWHCAPVGSEYGIMRPQELV